MPMGYSFFTPKLESLSRYKQHTLLATPLKVAFLFFFRKQRLRGGRGRSAGTPLQRGARVPLPPGALAITHGHGLARAPGSRARAPAPHGCCRTSRRESSTFAFGRLAGPDRYQMPPRGVGGLAGRLGSQPTTSAAHRARRGAKILNGVSGARRSNILESGAPKASCAA
jgi:hypothetical protein